MDDIIQETLTKLKGQVEAIAERFCRGRLSPASLARFEHDLHKRLGEVGRAVEKAVLERVDVEQPWIERDGARHYWKYKGPQEYQCLFGKIEVERSVYQANGERTVCPLELNAGIAHHHLTPPAAELVAFATSQMVPAEVEAFCQKFQYLQPCETVIKQVAAEVGEMAEEMREYYEEEIYAQEGPAPREAAVVVVSRDATTVNIRDERWKHAQVGSVAMYGEITGIDENGDVTRERLRTTYVAQMPEDSTPTFNANLGREVEHGLTGLDEGTTVVCIADGAQSIWKYFKANPRLKSGILINDFYHAAEHLNEIAEALFGKGAANADQWFAKYRKILKREDNGVNKVIRSIRYHSQNRTIRSDQRLKVIRDGLKYFTNNRGRMEYAIYRARGLPIGSGVVEACCKTVVGLRLKRPGMRWSREGGQHILNLRVLVLSKRWDTFWLRHEEALGEARVAA